VGTIAANVTEVDRRMLIETVRIARQAKAAGNHPFGALLADQAGNILMEQGNEACSAGHDCAHAETLLAIRASKAYQRSYLATCTLYTSVEPCAMCTGALYWANIGRLVYALSERRLLHLTGANEENPTFDLPCREVLGRGQKDIVVVGPVDDAALEAMVVADHTGFWD
jgi:tRNA(Arg) A34 adenosine deaminase TadA